MYNIEELRKRYNSNSKEEQHREYLKTFRKLNSNVKSFSKIIPVDKLTKEEEDYLREGIIEANNLRRANKL